MNSNTQAMSGNLKASNEQRAQNNDILMVIGLSM